MDDDNVKTCKLCGTILNRIHTTYNDKWYNQPHVKNYIVNEYTGDSYDVVLCGCPRCGMVTMEIMYENK